jgi:hypothetical protein
MSRFLCVGSVDNLRAIKLRQTSSSNKKTGGNNED